MTNDSMGKIINANINLSENICLRLKLEHQKHLLDNSQTDLFHKFQDAHHDIGPFGNKLLRQ